MDASAATVEEEEEPGKEAERRFAKLSRMITHGMTPADGDTPRVAIITSIGEPCKLRKNWRERRVRQPQYALPEPIWKIFNMLLLFVLYGQSSDLANRSAAARQIRKLVGLALIFKLALRKPAASSCWVTLHVHPQLMV